MPRPAFVPGQLAEAEGRSFRNFYPRQVRGLLAAICLGGLVARIAGVESPPGFLLSLLAMLPGLAYGFYRPSGKPAEHWIRVVVRYHREPKVVRFRSGGGRLRG